MPFMKLNTTAVTTSQPPHMISAARVGSVRGARRVMNDDPAAEQITAAGSSQAMSGAHLGAEQPAPADVEVQVAEPAGLVAGQPAEPVVAQGQFEDAVVLRAADVRPGRRPATARRAADTSQPDTTTAATATQQIEQPAAQRRCPRDQVRRANAGSTRNACSILARKPKPTAAPAATNHQRLLSFSHARCMQYAPATSSSTSSASGLLNRNISAATGVSARTAPASSAAPAPLTRRTAA